MYIIYTYVWAKTKIKTALQRARFNYRRIALYYRRELFIISFRNLLIEWNGKRPANIIIYNNVCRLYRCRWHQDFATVWQQLQRHLASRLSAQGKPPKHHSILYILILTRSRDAQFIYRPQAPAKLHKALRRKEKSSADRGSNWISPKQLRWRARESLNRSYHHGLRGIIYFNKPVILFLDFCIISMDIHGEGCMGMCAGIKRLGAVRRVP